jgi:20S proteasome alpha/beta subunit
MFLSHTHTLPTSAQFGGADPAQDKLIDPSSVSHLFQISPSVGCVMTGSIADARAFARRAQIEAAEFKYKFGYEMPCDAITKRLANLSQVYTQRVRVCASACTGKLT